MHYCLVGIRFGTENWLMDASLIYEKSNLYFTAILVIRPQQINKVGEWNFYVLFQSC